AGGGGRGAEPGPPFHHPVGVVSGQLRRRGDWGEGGDAVATYPRVRVRAYAISKSIETVTLLTPITPITLGRDPANREAAPSRPPAADAWTDRAGVRLE